MSCHEAGHFVQPHVVHCNAADMDAYVFAVLSVEWQLT